MALDWSGLPSRRAALRAFIASIVISALLGIWALLAGSFDELQIKVLLSSLSVSAASLCAMGGAVLLEGRGRRLPSVPAILLSGVGLLLLLVGVWSMTSSESFWKLTAAICFFGVACSHASLLCLARLSPGSAWMIPAAIALALLLATYGTFMLWAESGEELHFRLLGALSILLSAGSLAIPVLHKLNQAEGGTSSDTTDGGVDMLCPVCGNRLRHPLGEARCMRCGASFRLELLETREGEATPNDAPRRE